MRPRGITLGRFTSAFVPSGLLLAGALLGAEATLDLDRARLVYSVWVALALLTPALCAYSLPGATQGRRNTRALFWTFAWCAYLVHFYFAFFVHYHGSIRETFAHQGLRIAGPNFLLTAWWTLDVFLTWTTDDDSRWVSVQRRGVHGLAFAVALVSSVIVFRGFVRIIGAAMTVSVLVCLVARWIPTAWADRMAARPADERGRS
jgi:hypothetical protein